MPIEFAKVASPTSTQAGAISSPSERLRGLFVWCSHSEDTIKKTFTERVLNFFSEYTFPILDADWPELKDSDSSFECNFVRSCLLTASKDLPTFHAVILYFDEAYGGAALTVGTIGEVEFNRLSQKSWSRTTYHTGGVNVFEILDLASEDVFLIEKRQSGRASKSRIARRIESVLNDSTLHEALYIQLGVVSREFDSVLQSAPHTTHTRTKPRF